MESFSDPQVYASFFCNQTIFLTGATGGLGGCLLYKLALALPTQRIYVLVRSEAKARKTWRKTMPNQIGAILEDSDRVKLVVGDILKPNFGIEPDMLEEIEAQTTLIVHSAANTSFSMSVQQAIDNNCRSTLRLAEMASSFPLLQRFVHISTGYCNSNLPDGPIEEKIYPLGDAEAELAEITATGTSSHFTNSTFPWPYGYAKHLTERLLFHCFPGLPLLIVRPTCIGSAVSQPFLLYAPFSATPIEQAFKLLTLNPGTGIIYSAANSTSGTGSNIFDEIPVDWVSNLILLHAAAGTRGVVHAGAESFVPRSFDQLSRLLMEDTARERLYFVPRASERRDRSVPQCYWADFYKVLTRDWKFSNKSSERFRNVQGPLSICIEEAELRDYDTGRMKRMRAEVAASRRSRLRPRQARL